MTKPITIKVGFDNAGGLTIEVPEYQWSLHSIGDEMELALTIGDLSEGAKPDECWTNQWDEGVRADQCERVVEASDVQPGLPVESVEVKALMALLRGTPWEDVADYLSLRREFEREDGETLPRDQK